MVVYDGFICEDGRELVKAYSDKNPNNKHAMSITIDRACIDKYADRYFTEHPRATKMPIPYPYHESINKWMIMKRPQMNCLKQKWKDFIVWLVDTNGLTNKKIQCCDIEQRVFFPTNRRHDIDNTVPKFILDGLVESGLIEDDDSLHIKHLIMSCGVDKDNPRTELIITILQ